MKRPRTKWLGRVGLMREEGCTNPNPDSRDRPALLWSVDLAKRRAGAAGHSHQHPTLAQLRHDFDHSGLTTAICIRDSYYKESSCK
jgi:hypothetical protein